MTYCMTGLRSVLVLELLGPGTLKGQAKSEKLLAAKYVFQYYKGFSQHEQQFLEYLWCLQKVSVIKMLYVDTTIDYIYI